MKKIVYFLAALLLFNNNVASYQNTSPQIKNLESFALELGHYVKNDWCHSNLQSAQAQWADFFNRLILLNRAPQATEAALDFFKQALFEINEDNSPHFLRYLSEFLNNISSVSLSELQSERTEADHWGPYQMAREGARRIILLWSTVPSYGDRNYKAYRHLFDAIFPEPADFEQFACDQKVTEAIGRVHPLQLGSSAMFYMWNVVLSP